MTPDSVHLAVTLIRHRRSELTAIEKWIRSQKPASEISRESLRLLGLYRDVLTNIETAISKAEIDESADVQVM